MPEEPPKPSTRHEQSRVHERPPDPAEEAGVPLVPKESDADLPARDDPDEAGRREREEDPHHALNTPVGEPDPEADSDPFRPEDE